MTTWPTTEPRDPLRDALGFVAVDPPVWEGELDGYLVCAQVQDVTHDVRSFILRSPTGHRFRQLPGQYVTITVEIDGVAVSRCYTITSPGWMAPLASSAWPITPRTGTSSCPPAAASRR